MCCTPFVLGRTVSLTAGWGSLFLPAVHLQGSSAHYYAVPTIALLNKAIQVLTALDPSAAAPQQTDTYDGGDLSQVKLDNPKAC